MYCYVLAKVALFTRAWIEIQPEMEALDAVPVALFTRAWIEINPRFAVYLLVYVALFTRAWIEIFHILAFKSYILCRPLHEGVD